MKQNAHRLTTTFEKLQRQKRCALIAYLTAGDPLWGSTAKAALALIEAGADVIELGMPFSDPMADGPVIQRAAERAIKMRFMLKDVLKSVAEIRRKSEAPIVLMGYFNSVLHFGVEKFAAALARAGGDGVLLVDLPPEESEPVQAALQREGLQQIFLVAPTSDATRMQKISACAEGYLYYVSMTGVTGGALHDFQRVKLQVQALGEYTRLPIAVGFGVKTPDQAAKIAKFAGGVVVGSSLIERAQAARDAAAARKSAANFIAQLRRAMDRGKKN